MNTKPFLTLLKREIWEHRSLFWVPLILSGLIVISAFVGSSMVGSVKINLDQGESEFFARMDGNALAQSQLFAVWMGSLMIPVMLVTLIVLFFYLLDSLYAERKDRSILFWKSMPVSDASTVLSKLATALVSTPIWVWLLSIVTGLLVFAAVAIRVSGTPMAALGEFHIGTWIVLQFVLLQNLLLAALWYAPVAGWLLLVSAWARRSPFLWAVLPPAVVAIVEDILFDTNYTGRLITYRLSGFNEDGFALKFADGEQTERIVDSIRVAYDSMSMASLLAEPHLYTGLVAAAAFVYAAIRLRRWRDDA